MSRSASNTPLGTPGHPTDGKHSNGTPGGRQAGEPVIMTPAGIVNSPIWRET
ncbi:hypothetical protein C9F11_39955 [Streptomyces sp. YIM 121038]|nr:hypothetical protein C9F11_39955 [Streptomyces sp. YIM 121038]